MKRLFILLTLVVLVVSMFAAFVSTKQVSADPSPTTSNINLTTTKADLSKVQFSWVNASTIQAVFPTDTTTSHINSSGVVIDFYSRSSPGGLDGILNNQDAQYWSGPSGQQSTCLTNQSDLTANPYKTSTQTINVYWSYFPPGNTANCTASPQMQYRLSDNSTGTDPNGNPIYPSHIIYSYSSGVISTTDNSVGQETYTPSSGFPDVYAVSGVCSAEIVVSSNGQEDLWPLIATEGRSRDGQLGETTVGSSSAAQAADAVSCYINDNIQGSISDAGVDYKLAGGNVNSNGAIPVYVPGLKYVKSKGAPPISTGGCTSGSDCKTTLSFDSECSESGGAFSWFICAAIDWITNTENYIITNIIKPMLTTPVLSFSGSPTCTTSETAQQCNQVKVSASIYKVWSNFRLYGDILLVIAVLAVVFAESLGGGAIEAFSAKRMLPRILAAAILINLSIYIVAGLEDVINIIGSGIETIIQAPFESLIKSGTLQGVTVSGGTGILASLGLGTLTIVAGIAEGFFGIALFIFGALFLAALGVVVTILIRQALLVLLLLIAPIAFALYCLPNTEQYFRKWWDLLFKTLLVFPIVMAVMGMSTVAAVVVNNFNIQPPILAQLMGIAAAVAPLFLIPFAFKISGGVIGQVATGVDRLKERAREPIRNIRTQNRHARGERMREGNLFRGENFLARRGSALAQGLTLAPQAGMSPWRMRSRYRAAKSTRTSASAARVGENAAAAAVISNDDLLNASLSGHRSEGDARAYLSQLGQRGAELEQNVASITQAKRAVGREAFEDAAVAALPGTGTGFASGPAEMLEAINRVAGHDRARAARLLAAARSQAERARRVDLYGAGFATSADQMAQLYAGHTNAATVNEVMTDEALNTKSAGEVASSRNNAVTNMSGSMTRRLALAQHGVNEAQNALASARSGGNPHSIQTAQDTLAEALHHQKRVLAAQAGLHDVAAQLSPENAATIGAVQGEHTGRMHIGPLFNPDGSPTLDPNGQQAIGPDRPEQYGDAIESLRSDYEFQQYRRELNSPTATFQQQQGLGGVIPPTAGPPPPPGVIPPPGGGPVPSDMRLKTGIKHISTLSKGVKLYSFRYIWGGPIYVGVMAQEVADSYPDSVTMTHDGYYLVDYSVLGIEMQTLEEWKANAQ